LGDRIQNEIEAFLQQVTGQRPSRPAKKRRPRKRPPAQEQRPSRRHEEGPQGQRRRPPKQRPRRLKKRRPQSENRGVGSGIAEHVDEYINQHVKEHIDHDVDEHVQVAIVDEVTEHLGPGEKPKAASTGPSAAQSVRELLKDPSGVRNAILVNEILSRPRALRRD